MIRFLFALAALSAVGLLCGVLFAAFWIPAVWIFNTITRILS